MKKILVFLSVLLFPFLVNASHLDEDITILENDMFDLSFLLGIAKIFGIICVILFFIILIDSLINLESQFNNLKNL